MAQFIDLRRDKKKHFVFQNSGEYIVFLYNQSGKYTFELAHEQVKVKIYGLFIGQGQDEFSIETIQHHKAESSVSDLFIKGVFDDYSRFHYQGLIRIEKDGQKSHAYQKNQNLIMSSSTFVESKPYLEILANDVFCTHGSTTGRLNLDEIIYLNSRGIERAAARKLLIDGFIQDILLKVQQDVPQFNPDEYQFNS